MVVLLYQLIKLSHTINTIPLQPLFIYFFNEKNIVTTVELVTFAFVPFLLKLNPLNTLKHCSGVFHFIVTSAHSSIPLNVKGKC